MNAPTTATSALLSVRDLRTWFPIRRGVFARTHGHVRAVDNISFDLAEGEALGLVGESGCGKSTLARTILGLERARTGTVSYEGAVVSGLGSPNRAELARHLQIIFQDPFASLNPRQSVLELITEGAIYHGVIPARARLTRARELLTEVGLRPEHVDRYPHEFSGGQRQRISIARALSMEPRLIICDEAVSALDVSVQAQILNLLTDLRDRLGLSYLFISHDLSVVRHICDRVAVMYLGEIVEIGATDAVIHGSRHPYTQALVSAIPQLGRDRDARVVLQGDVPSAADPPPGCRFHTRCPYADEQCRTQQPSLQAHDGVDVACHHVGTFSP